MRQAQRAEAQPVAVALAMRAGFGDMAEGVGARVAVGTRILSPADADRIEDDDQRAGHSAPPPSPGGGGSAERARARSGGVG